MSGNRQYTTAQVLSMTTGVLLCEIDGLYGIASGLLGREVWTHELPAAARECRPWILAHHPQLAAITGAGVTSENWAEWLDARIAEVGPSFVVPPLTYSATAEKSPIETAIELVGEDKVIVVDTREPADD